MSTKAVRFSDNEEKVITEFLEKNLFFDFSTLARLSIMQFIENPELNLSQFLPIQIKKKLNLKN